MPEQHDVPPQAPENRQALETSHAAQRIEVNMQKTHEVAKQIYAQLREILIRKGLRNDSRVQLAERQFQAGQSLKPQPMFEETPHAYDTLDMRVRNALGDVLQLVEILDKKG